MADDSFFVDNLESLLPPTAPDSIVSRAFHSAAEVRATLFGFAAGQELSEHTASSPAVIHILRGEAQLTLGSETCEAREGAWVHMPAQLPHSVQAKTQLVMLLLLLKSQAGER